MGARDPAGVLEVGGRSSVATARFLLRMSFDSDAKSFLPPRFTGATLNVAVAPAVLLWLVIAGAGSNERDVILWKVVVAHRNPPTASDWPRSRAPLTELLALGGVALSF